MVGGGFHNQVSGHMKSEDIKNVVQHANMLGHHFFLISNDYTHGANNLH